MIMNLTLCNLPGSAFSSRPDHAKIIACSNISIVATTKSKESKPHQQQEANTKMTNNKSILNTVPLRLNALTDNKGDRVPVLATKPDKIYAWRNALNMTVTSWGDEYAAVLGGFFPTTNADHLDQDGKTVPGLVSLEESGRLTVRKVVAQLYVNPDEVSVQHPVGEGGERKTSKRFELSDRKLRHLLFAIERKLYALFFWQQRRQLHHQQRRPCHCQAFRPDRPH